MPPNPTIVLLVAAVVVAGVVVVVALKPPNPENRVDEVVAGAEKLIERPVEDAGVAVVAKFKVGAVAVEVLPKLKPNAGAEVVPKLLETVVPKRPPPL